MHGHAVQAQLGPVDIAAVVVQQRDTEQDLRIPAAPSLQAAAIPTADTVVAQLKRVFAAGAR